VRGACLSPCPSNVRTPAGSDRRRCSGQGGNRPTSHSILDSSTSPIRCAGLALNYEAQSVVSYCITSVERNAKRKTVWNEKNMCMVLKKKRASFSCRLPEKGLTPKLGQINSQQKHKLFQRKSEMLQQQNNIFVILKTSGNKTCSKRLKNIGTSPVCFHNKIRTILLHFETTTQHRENHCSKRQNNIATTCVCFQNKTSLFVCNIKKIMNKLRCKTVHGRLALAMQRQI
jgi:hypothetical protein